MLSQEQKRSREAFELPFRTAFQRHRPVHEDSNRHFILPYVCKHEKCFLMVKRSLALCYNPVI